MSWNPVSRRARCGGEAMCDPSRHGTSNATLIEAQRYLPITGTYDVAVVGGGVAGVAAAVAAARTGASVILIERTFGLGGLATLGLITTYEPLCDGHGHQVSFGLSEEMLALSVRDGSAFLPVPEGWADDRHPEARMNHRYLVQFNASSYLLALEEFVLGNGVHLLYDTRFCSVCLSGNRIDALIVENKSGRSAIRCRTVIDATGDADICAAAGEEVRSFKTNTVNGWYYSHGDNGLRLHRLSRPFDPSAQGVPLGAGPGFAGDEAYDVTQQMIASRALIRSHLAETRREENTDHVFPFLVPTLPGFRMTRRLVGAATFEADDRKDHPDSIGLISDWRRRGPIYSIPFRCLCAVKTPNLITAGRCISAGLTGWDMSRVIPACVVTGEAAGVAAGMTDDFASLKVPMLQAKLRHNGIKLQVGDVV